MNIYARSALIGFFAFSVTGVLLAGDYYIYRDSKGLLVISNQKPPAGSQIIRQRTLPDEAENEAAEPKKDDVRPGRSKAATPAQTRQ
jgi:hypothetical protein